MEFFKGKFAEILNYTFQMLLVTYLLLLLTERIWSGFVSTYLNLNYLLIIVIIFGILDVFSKKEAPKKELITWKDYAYIILLAVAGFIIIKFKTAELGWLSWVISIIAGLLIGLLSHLILEDDETEEEVKEFKFTKKNTAIIIGSIFAALFVLTVILSFFMTFLESARIVFGSVYVLFLPGFIISFIFFPKTMKSVAGDIDSLERLALSFVLSIAIVPLLVFYLNLIGMRINTLNVALTVLGIILISASIIYIMVKRKK